MAAPTDVDALKYHVCDYPLPFGEPQRPSRFQAPMMQTDSPLYGDSGEFSA